MREALGVCATSLSYGREAAMAKPKPGDQKPGSEERPERARHRGEKDDRRAVERSVDDALEGSFPASDPPPWTLGRKPRADAPDADGD